MDSNDRSLPCGNCAATTGEQHTAECVETRTRDAECLKCHRPVVAHVRWSIETARASGCAPSVVGMFVGHDPLVAGVGFIS